MKLQLIEEIDGCGISHYSTEKDGEYVTGTATLDYAIALHYFEMAVKNSKVDPEKKILKEVEL